MKIFENKKKSEATLYDIGKISQHVAYNKFQFKDNTIYEMFM